MLRQNQNTASSGNTQAGAAASLPIMTSLVQQQPNSRQSQQLSAITLTPEQIGKLNSELDIVECNVQVFNDVINELTQTQVQNNNLDDYSAEIELLRVSYLI